GVPGSLPFPVCLVAPHRHLLEGGGGLLVNVRRRDVGDPGGILIDVHQRAAAPYQRKSGGVVPVAEASLLVGLDYDRCSGTRSVMDMTKECAICCLRSLQWVMNSEAC
ncbi:unnamed protein product, partial [Urochloa humidicola]